MDDSQAASGLILEALAPGIYAAGGDQALLRPWVGILVTPAGTLLVDSGNGPLHAADLQAALERLQAPPVTHILLTHHHWDHVFGSAYFPTAHVVAHVQSDHHLQIMAGEPWSYDYVLAKAGTYALGRRVAALMDGAIADWNGFSVRPADETFTGTYRLTLGGFTVEMTHVGGQHEPDQCIVHVQPGNVLFLGDATYGRGGSERWDMAALGAELLAFADRGAEWYVEGHRPPARAARFRQRARRVARFGTR